VGIKFCPVDSNECIRGLVPQECQGQSEKHKPSERIQEHVDRRCPWHFRDCFENVCNGLKEHGFEVVGEVVDEVGEGEDEVGEAEDEVGEAKKADDEADDEAEDEADEGDNDSDEVGDEKHGGHSNWENGD